jgi:Ca2+-binding RTX toxin-like protein
MAKLSTIKLFDRFQGASFSFADAFVVSGSKTKAVFIDSESGARLILEGENLRINNGTITGGFINEARATTHDNKPFIELTNLHLDARFVAGDSIGEFSQLLTLATLVKSNRFIGSDVAETLPAGAGNDKIFGRGGDDQINGSFGNDKMTGGTGNDQFEFETGSGRDTITDFDAEGGAGFQDLIDADLTNVSIEKSGKNTIIDFGEGDTLTLLNIAPEQIDAADFVV